MNPSEKSLVLAFWPFNLSVDFGQATERETGKGCLGCLTGDFEESLERVHMAEPRALACLDYGRTCEVRARHQNC